MMQQSGSTWYLAQAVTKHHEYLKQFAAREEGALFPPYSRIKLLEQLAPQNQQKYWPSPDRAFVVDQPAHGPCGIALEKLQRVSHSVENKSCGFLLIFR